MAAFFAELVFDILRRIVGDWLMRAMAAVCVWLEPKIQNRTARFVVGGVLGIVLYFLVPIVLGVLGL